MDLTELIDYYILPRLSPRMIKFVARNSWGRPRNLLIIPMPGIRCVRVYVVCNAICHLLTK